MYTTIEHDAVVAAWKEKVRHNLVRPTSYSRWAMPEKEVQWYDGSMISTKDWTPLIRTMPHAEYPSGSMAICQSVADFTKLWVQNVVGLDDLKTKWMVKKGAATKEGLFPSEDWEG